MEKEKLQSEESDRPELVPSLDHFDLADYVLDDFSFDFSERHSDNDSEFSFIEIPGTQDRDAGLSNEEYTIPNTPSSSEWSLLECGQTSDIDLSDADLEEVVETKSPCSDVQSDEVTEDRTESTQKCTKQSKANRSNKKGKAGSQYNADLMMQLFGGLSICGQQEEASLLEVQECTDTVQSTSKIPSLTDLCMKKIHLYRKRPLLKKIIQSSKFPVGLKKTILSSNLQYSVTKSTLSWLLQNLSVLETKLAKYDQRCSYSSRLKDGNSLLFDCMSNIWKQSDDVSSVLIDVCFDRYVINSFIFYEQLDFSIVFSTVMKIMITNTSKHVRKNDCIVIKTTKCRKNYKNKGDDVGILHQFLKSRFPIMTALCFELNVPYAFWARGNFRRALQAFVRLYKERSVSEKKKLFIIGEIGRLYAMLYESVKAVKMYRLLETCLLQFKPSESGLIEAQTQLLIVDLQNQGVLTESKARNLPSAWNTALRSCPPDKRDQLYIEAAENLLCLHLGNLLGEKTDSMNMVREVLQDYSKHNPEVWYHLAFLNAILGFSKESDHCYGEFIKCIEGVDMDDEEARHKIPGLAMVDLLTSRKLAHHQMDALKLAVQTPFEPLLSLPPSDNVKPMRVIWRRQFHHCHVSNHGGCAGFDLCPPDLSLRLTADGHITGDCSLLFPPISNILLDPYTGLLKFDPEENRLNPWKTFPTSSNYNFFDYLTSLPNAVEIYHHQDKDGEVQVYLSGNQFFKAINPSPSHWGYNFNPQADPVIFLHWSGPGGQKAKFSLVQKMKDYLYQNAVDCVKDICGGDDVGKVTSLLQKWHRQGMAMTSNETRRALAFIQAKQAAGTDKKRKTKHEAQPRGIYKLRLVFVSTPQRVGTNVLLTVQVGQDCYQVIIRCHDRESFISPIITKINKSELLLTSPHSLFFCKKETERKIQFYDCEGRQIREVSVGCNLQFNKMTLVGNNFIFIHENRLSMVDVHNGHIKRCDDFMECELVGVLLDVVILKNQYGVKFADGGKSHLKPMEIQLHTSLLQSYLPFKISENGEQLNGNFVHVEALAEGVEILAEGVEILAEDVGGTGSITVDNAVILFTVRTSQDGSECQSEIVLTQVLELPGFATKLKFLPKSVGFLVGWSQHSLRDPARREHLFQYSYGGRLLGVLPFLGRTQSSWCVEYLVADPTTTQSHPTCGHGGWHLYMQDGRQGILCVRLFQDEVHE